MKKRIFALALCVCMLLAVAPAALANGVLTLNNGSDSSALTLGNPDKGADYTPTTTTSEQTETNGSKTTKRSSSKAVNADGIETWKEVSSEPDADGNYTVKLEAWTTGTVTDVPSDIVLVLDKSSFMSDDAVEYRKVWKSEVNNSSNQDETYYIMDENNNYLPVSYCGEHLLANGWWMGWHFIFHWGSWYEAKDNENDTTADAGSLIYGRPTVTQFYKRYVVEGEQVTKLDTIKTAATSFVNTLKTAEATKNVDHRIAIISSGKVLGLTSIQSDADFVGTIANITNEANTPNTIASDMDAAKAAFDANLDSDRNRIVVVLAGSMPGGTTWDGTAANSAISTAKTLKGTGYDASIYVLGMMDDAAPTLNIEDSRLDDSTEQAVLINKFLHYLSSNYPNAASMSDRGSDGSYTRGYYMAGASADTLTAIFDKVKDQVSNQTGGTMPALMLSDTVTEYFEVVNGSIITQTQNYNGEEFAGTKNNVSLTTDITGRTVTASGFDFNSNYITATKKPNTNNDFGRKLIVTFKIKRADGFLGGNSVPTNVFDASGVCNAETGALMETFAADPTTNVPVSVPEFTINNPSIYLSNSINTSALYTEASFTGENAWKDEFVTVTYAVNGATPTDVTPTDCTNFTVTCTVNGGGTNTTSTSKPATVHVVKPTITNSDTTVYLSNSIDLNTQMQEAAVWTCSHSGVSLPVTEDSARVAPVVDYTFAGVADETAYAPDACADITVSATVGTNETPFALADNSFKVHVLKPTVVAEEKTIWQSESVTSTATVTGWNCECTDVTHTMHKDSEKPDETIEMPRVTPEDCTKYTATYTVGDTDFTADYWVHVLTADLSMSDPVIYLSQTVAFADHDTVTWETQCEHGKRLTSDAPAASAVVDGEASAAPKICMNYEADLKIGKTVYTKDVPFTVHVVCPVVTATDATIKLGNKAPETGHVDWEMESGVLTSGKFVCECDNHHNASAMPDTKPVLSVQHTGAEYPTACSNNGHKATALIDGVLWEDYYANYTVHVQTPIVTGTDTAIYLGNDTTLAAEITGWNVCAHDKALTDNTDPTGITYTYMDVAEGAKVKPETCTPYTVGLKTIGGVTLAGTEYPDEFTVHVHVPQFTVTAQDLWADYNASVHLYNDTDSDAVVSIAQIWVDRRGDDSTLIATGNDVVDITDFVFHKIDDTVMTNPYTMVDSDVDVNIIKITADVNGEDYAAVKADSTEDTDKQLSVTKAKSEEDHDFTVHVNKFKAIITNNGTQNAIYTLSNGTKVAVEAGKSTTVAGLICGKDYEISEANNDWTWRYATEATKNTAAYTVGSVDNKPETDSQVNIGMNYGSITNAKWLADEDCVVNKATTQATTISPTLSVKKKDEEVTNV